MTPLKPNAMKSMQIIRNAVLLLSLITLGPLSSTAVTPGIVSSPGEKTSVVENPAMTTAPTAIAAHPVETPSSLTLEECYAKAGTNYPLVSRYGLIQQSEQYSLSNANKGYLPQFSFSAKATYQTDVTKIPVSIPGVDPNAEQRPVPGARRTGSGDLGRRHDPFAKAQHQRFDGSRPPAAASRYVCDP